ncbi:MAG: hypothetical protein A4E57_01222 [Syntrophorhabdaceae bacterium PtaU1.Bin034]|jgi:hypothetical protein|nr:MAG: hypothetical protein A4E57_01222 [Syntrophorhabdaceae bacterium PtaU1.Bin034]
MIFVDKRSSLGFGSGPAKRGFRVKVSVAGFLVACLFDAVSPDFLLRAAPTGAPGNGKAVVEQAAAPVIEVTRGRRIRGHIVNLTLSEVLRLMSERGLFDIKGALPLGGSLSITFLDFTLDETLKKLMRGHNYALLHEGPAKRPVLMLMGKVVRPDPAIGYARQLVNRLPVNRVVDRRSYVPPAIIEPQQPIRKTRAGRRSDQAGRPQEASGRRTVAPTGRGTPVPGAASTPDKERRMVGGNMHQQPGPTVPVAQPENTGVRF